MNTPVRLGIVFVVALVIQLTVFVDVRIFGVAPEGVAELEKFLGYLESSRRAAVVRLDAATKAYVPAQTVDATAPALVLRPFHAPRT